MKAEYESQSMSRMEQCVKCANDGMYLMNGCLHVCSCGSYRARINDAKAHNEPCPFCNGKGIIKLKGNKRFPCTCATGRIINESATIKEKEEREEKIREIIQSLQYEHMSERKWSMYQVMLSLVLFGSVLFGSLLLAIEGPWLVLVAFFIFGVPVVWVYARLIRDERGESWVSRSEERLRVFQWMEARAGRVLMGISGGVLLYQGAAKLSWFWPLCMVLGGMVLLVGCVVFFPRKS